MLFFLSRLGNKKVFNFSHASYSVELKKAVVFLGLKVVLSPHILRHSGASNDRFFGFRDLEEIRRRGFWKTHASVEVYDNHALLVEGLRQLAPDQQADCRSAERRLSGLIPKFFK